MKWSYQLGRFFGIDVRIHLTFFLLLAWVGLSALLQGGLLASLVNMLLVAAVFAFVVLHEYGHALTARHFGIRTRQITLYPIGGMAMLERMPQRPYQQLLVALAGPAVNFVLAGVIAALMGIGGTSFVYGDSALGLLFWANVIMGSFNLLPALPMDGGRVLRALLASRMQPAKATALAARVAKFVAVGMAVYALVNSQPMLLLIAGFVWLASGAEARFDAAADRVRARAYPTHAFQDDPSMPYVEAQPVQGATEHGPGSRGPQRVAVKVVDGPFGPRLLFVRLP